MPNINNFPYWWRDAPRPSALNNEPPTKVDVSVVGAGITGLNAALVLARAGLSVAVFKAGQIG